MDAALGTYALDVLVELMDGRKLEAIGTFVVAEPLDVSSSVTVSKGKEAVMRASLAVDLYSRVPNGTKATLEAVSFPEGWIVEGKKNRGVEFDRQNIRKIAKMNFKLPTNIAAGEYPVELTLTWNKRVWHLKHTVKIMH